MNSTDYKMLEITNVEVISILQSWAAPIVIIKKEKKKKIGKLRVCADYSTRLNNALLSIINDLRNIHKMKAIFSKMDFRMFFLS